MFGENECLLTASRFLGIRTIDSNVKAVNTPSVKRRVKCQGPIGIHLPLHLPILERHNAFQWEFAARRAV